MGKFSQSTRKLGVTCWKNSDYLLCNVLWWAVLSHAEKWGLIHFSVSLNKIYSYLYLYMKVKHFNILNFFLENDYLGDDKCSAWVGFRKSLNVVHYHYKIEVMFWLMIFVYDFQRISWRHARKVTRNSMTAHVKLFRIYLTLWDQVIFIASTIRYFFMCVFNKMLNNILISFHLIFLLNDRLELGTVTGFHKSTHHSAVRLVVQEPQLFGPLYKYLSTTWQFCIPGTWVSTGQKDTQLRNDNDNKYESFHYFIHQCSIMNSSCIRWRTKMIGLKDKWVKPIIAFKLT